MSVFRYPLASLKVALGLTDEQDGLERLRELLAEREAELSLEATYGEPRPNMTDEPTVVFPYTMYTNDGTVYGTGTKEFRLPDNGLDETGSPLVQFVARRHGISTADVTFEALADVAGTTADARINERGDIEVGAV